MTTDIRVYIAAAILLGLPFLGVVIYRRGAAALFAAPRSRIAGVILGSIIFGSFVVAIGVLTMGGRWHYVLPWCGFLQFVYLWIRGACLLLRLSPESDSKRKEAANTA